jgi:hypothetical protein
MAVDVVQRQADAKYAISGAPADPQAPEDSAESAAPVIPDDPTAIAMFTAHRLDDTVSHLAHATERMQVARATDDPELRAYHSRHITRHLAVALDAGHALAANLRQHYPAEGAELDAVAQTVGLAKALTPEVKAATTAHLLETCLHEETHGVRHAEQMLNPDPPDVWEFNADHARKHLAGAVEHAGKLRGHMRDNYPDVAKWLAGLDEITAGEDGGDGEPQHARYAKGDGGTITAQLANRGYDLNPRRGWISLDLPPGTIAPPPGGISDHHVTVVYLGADVDDDAFAQACDRAQKAAAAMPGPLTGMVGGIGTFPPSGGSDGKTPVWAGAVLPGADQLRQSLADLSASEHAQWHPHVTIMYADPGDALPAPQPAMQVSFSHLSVHRGDDEVVQYPFGGTSASDCCGAQCCAGGCCDGSGGCQCGPVTVSRQAAVS